MISFLVYTKSKNELTLLKQTVTDISSVLSDEDLKMYAFHQEINLKSFWKTVPCWIFRALTFAETAE